MRFEHRGRATVFAHGTRLRLLHEVSEEFALPLEHDIALLVAIALQPAVVKNLRVCSGLFVKDVVKVFAIVIRAVFGDLARNGAHAVLETWHCAVCEWASGQ